MTDDTGAVFPPRNWRDIWAYDDDDVVAGYREFRPGDPEPRPNRPAGYRWGWTNARGDRTGYEDGHRAVRREYIEKTKHMLFGTRSQA